MRKLIGWVFFKSSVAGSPSVLSEMFVKEEAAEASGSGGATPNRTRIDQPRTIAAAKGGCWYVFFALSSYFVHS